MLRRLFWLAVLSGAGFAGWTAWQRRNQPAPNGPAVWPPFDDASRAPRPAEFGSGQATSTGAPDAGDGTLAAFADVTTAPDQPSSTDAAPGGDPVRRWVAPVDGRCPDGYPIKGNDNSGIYHVPGGRFYERTVPERCYADEADAIADGYRRAKA